MKKVLLSILLCFTFISFANSQNSSAVSANRNTALRCLKLAENCLVGDDWENALKQAELGLSYDDNISDLIYLKAAALINMGKSKAEVINIIKSAFEKDDWVGYSKNGARILYSDLLSDTGFYDDSMKILDENQMLYSADAEFIRIKNLYRMGTEASINSARLKLNSARRIYPSDVRFPNIFFMFEFVYLMENTKVNHTYVIPEIVRTISAFYLKKLPDYSGNNLELELLASFFATPEEKNRLVNAIYAKNQTENPVLALAGMEVGLFSDQQGFDLFFELCDGIVSLELLQILIGLISDNDVKNQLMEKMLNYSGIIEIDTNFDLQNELIVEYETGRPKTIKYDENNDGVLDIFSTCDFGAPNFIYFEKENAELFYDSYPSVKKITYKDENYILNYLQDDLKFSVFNLIPDFYIQMCGIDFYVPNIVTDLSFPSKETLINAVSTMEMSVSERNDGRVVYALSEGKFISAVFFENDTLYAKCDFSQYPISRFSDNDFDGYFETEELYELSLDNTSTLYDKAVIIKTFGDVLKDYPLYLKKVKIDRNGNRFHEYTEEYLENGGRIACWDNDDDGIIDCQYICYGDNENNSLNEETIYFDKDGNEETRLNTIGGIPVKMTFKGAEVMVYAGNNNNLYWIENEGSPDYENMILSSIRNGMVQGRIELIEIDQKRISVILVGKSVYCKILPDSNVLDIEQDEQEVLQ